MLSGLIPLRNATTFDQSPIIVRDANGQALVYAYFEDDLGGRSAAKTDR
jgi:hypothetical protein